MIPPQAIHGIGRAFVQFGGWAVGNLISRTFDADIDIARLLRLSERSLLKEVGRRSDPSRRLRSEEAVDKGRSTIERLQPVIQARLCPQREALLAMLGAPETQIATTIWQLLEPGVVSALARPIAVLIVKRGIGHACRGWAPPLSE
jgi:hypothetical protein